MSVNWLLVLFQLGLRQENFGIKKLVFQTLITLPDEILNRFFGDSSWFVDFFGALDEIHSHDEILLRRFLSWMLEVYVILHLAILIPRNDSSAIILGLFPILSPKVILLLCHHITSTQVNCVHDNLFSPCADSISCD
jgi:hypothetical protein